MLAQGYNPNANINNSRGQHPLFQFTGVLPNLLPERRVVKRDWSFIQAFLRV